MENKNNINKGNKNNIMKRLLLVLVLLTFMIVPTFAVDDLILFYEYEEGTGGIALDSSGNNNIGILDGVTYDSNAGQLKSGLYSADFSDNDVITASIPELQGNDFTFSTYHFKKNHAGDNIILDLTYDGVTYARLLYNDNGGQEYRLSLRDDINALQEFDLDSISTGSVTDETGHDILLTINKDTSLVQFYLDSTLIHNATYGFNLHTNFSNLNLAKIGEGIGFLDGMKGNLDDTKLYNFYVNLSQATQINNGAEPTIPEEGGEGNEGNNETPEVVINGTQLYDIINAHLPFEADVQLSPASFQATLNTQASCDLYLNNNYVTTYTDVLAFNDLIELSPGNYSYFLYCSVLDNDNILLFELSNVTNFEVQEPLPSTIRFVFSSSEFAISQQNLFMVSPCLRKGIAIPGGSVSAYSMLLNKDPVYFEPLESGISEFTMPSGEHEFCLIHGVGQYNVEDDFSDLWKINLVQKQTKIGNFDVPSNVTTTFGVNLDNFDIYKVQNPKAWNTSWVAIISSLIAFFIGVILLVVGIEAKEPKLSLIGGFLVMLSLGFTLNNVLVGVLF